MRDDEEPLIGGFEPGRVVRIGDTVRGPSGPWTATSQALLAHLAAKGFPAPRPLGLDEKGREIVGWLAGRASNWPWPAALLAPQGARRIGEMLVRHHAAIADFAPADPVWRHGSESLGHGQIALHGDLGPHNLIWSGDAIVGVIDFELARPGKPMDDAGSR